MHLCSTNIPSPSSDASSPSWWPLSSDPPSPSSSCTPCKPKAGTGARPPPHHPRAPRLDRRRTSVDGGRGEHVLLFLFLVFFRIVFLASLLITARPVLAVLLRVGVAKGMSSGNRCAAN
ncbi:hypothetical protein CEXT_408661 [Caerostris extrusa]|uniref:Uncharacterized protein n=1 Tax=Caerostris extrusa TaxID=172846 RepID=A0AAV4Y7G3_CAEEX|nr:hypothetical protein CEXT_408661 [Caerostris extrusa]